VAVVEDDASLLGALTFALRADRYDVAPYGTAARALADVRQCSCIVADLRLPDIDGLTLIAQLRARGVQAPAILITSNPDARCRRRAAAAQVTIVEKPLLGSELNTLIASAIGRSAS
jgi:FixJ family two-component response regulator